MIKAAFFDVDGTLLPKYHKQIPNETVAALRRLREEGIKVVLCTGRGVEELDFTDFAFDGYILLNGQLCLDEQMKTYFENPIEGSDKEALITVFNGCEVPVVLTERDRVYMNFHNDYVKAVSKEISIDPHPVEAYIGGEIYLATIYAQKPMKIGDLSADRWHEWAFDAYSPGGGKHRGMQEYCRRYRITPENTIAFGDAENDIGMLSAAGIGVAMGNAYDLVKQAVDYVTVDTADSGIVKALKHFGLI